MDNFFQEFLSEFTLPLESPVLVMSVILIIILLSPLVLEKIKAPSIIGLIIAGVIIGPYGLNILSENMFTKIFSTIGLLYIMFIAGLELDLNEFKVNRNKSILFAFYTFIIPLGIGYPACRYLLGFDFNASFLTAAMFATHTLVAYPIIIQKKLSKNPAVAATVGGTILTDTAVLIILAIILGNSQGGLSSQFWIRLGISLLVFSVILFVLVPKLAKWFFSKFEEKNELHYVFVLAMVFFAAFFAQAAGLEPIIGAFAAGIALNKLIPASSALMNRVEFIGNSIFIPFFLISVGMLVDVRVIFHGWNAWIVAGTLMLVGIGGKWLAAWSTQKTFRFSPTQRKIIFGLSGGHAAATLAVVTVGYNAGIMDKTILNGTIILILVACLIASIVTERAAIRLKEETEGDTEAILKSSGADSEQILLTVSDPKNMEKMLELAILVKDEKSPHPIGLLTVVENTEEAEVNIAKAKEDLQSLVEEASATETKVDVLTTIEESREEGIQRMTKETAADILLLDWEKGRFHDLETNHFLKGVNKTLLICNFVKPLAIHGKIHLIVPPKSNLESGFEGAIFKVTMIAQELSCKIAVYCGESEQQAIEEIKKKFKLSTATNFISFANWEDFLVLSRYMGESDLIIPMAVRVGAVSYMKELPTILKNMERYFLENNFIVLYPEQTEIEEAEMPLPETTSTPPRSGMSKWMKKVLKRKNKRGSRS